MVNKLDPDAVPQWLAMLWPHQSSDPFVVAGIIILVISRRQDKIAVDLKSSTENALKR